MWRGIIVVSSCQSNLIQQEMTITEIKAQLGVEKLGLNWFTAEDGTKTPWLRNWDNSQRRAVLMHKDVDELLQAQPNYSNLDLKRETKTGEKGEYENIVIIAFKPADREY